MSEWRYLPASRHFIQLYMPNRIHRNVLQWYRFLPNICLYLVTFNLMHVYHSCVSLGLNLSYFSINLVYYFHSALETINPMISCPPNEMRFISSSTEQVFVMWPLPTATDSSGIMLITSNPVYSSGSGIFGSGTHSITYTATDGAGNQASCFFTITVIC